MYTSPTGFSAVPPPGPAMPVTETATSAPSRARAPAAIAAAVSAETAPCRRNRSAGTPSSRCFTSSEYATIPPTKTSLDPGTDVSREPIIPPVIDSAVASVNPRSRQSCRTISSIGRSSSAACEHAVHRSSLQRLRPEALQLSRRAGKDHDRRAPSLQDESRRRAREAERDRACGHGRLFADARLEVRVRTLQALGDHTGDAFDLRLQLGLDLQLEPRRACDELHRSVVMRRTEAAGDDAEISP